MKMCGAGSAVLLASSLATAGPVIVALDMDVQAPGIQPSVTVQAGVTSVEVAVYLYDPDGTHGLVQIGYLGGIDRGIAFGHIPDNNNHGSVTGLDATPVSAANPANTGFLSGAIFHVFAGAELQYLEIGAQQAAPIQMLPDKVLFKVRILLANARQGDRFRFALADLFAMASQGAQGVFITQPGRFWDTGGDSVPDGTPTLRGPDADLPVPVPPAAFAVDFVDGVTGPALIIVDPCYANCDGSTLPAILNVNDFVCFLNRYAAGSPYANCDGSTAQPALNLNDFTCFMNEFAAGCP